MHWKEKYDEHAASERDLYRRQELSVLLDMVRRGVYGTYYTIWYVIAEKADPSPAAAVLFEVLKTDADYLYRYHAAAALLELIQETGFKPVDLSADNKELAENLRSMETLLRTGNLLA